MKKLLLMAFAISLAAIVSAQTVGVKKEIRSTKNPELFQMVYADQSPVNNVTIPRANPNATPYTVNKAGRDITFTPIGEAGNAFGFFGGPRTYLWADPRINSVVFTHRMLADAGTSGTGRIAYDLSTERGLDGTWTNNIQTYEPTLAPDPQPNGRYPQGAIMNPPDNTDPTNAYYSYFIPTLDNTNPNSGNDWGGYAYGVNPLTEIDPPAATQHNVSSGNGYLRRIPNAYTITQQGEMWMVDGNFDGAFSEYQYTGEIIINHGVWNEAAGDFDYEEELFSALAEADGINDMKIAFSPDGQTGYIMVMSDCVSDPQPWTNYHPILYKTEDGGLNWDDTPIHVLLGGEDGLEEVKNFIPDEIMEEYFPGYNRDEIYYNMGFDADLIVDAYGNPHITGIIAMGNEEGWYPYDGTMATFHVYSMNQGEDWESTMLYENITLDGDLDNITQKNRPMISSSICGMYFFMSWLDTDVEGMENNISPDIYVVAYDLDMHEYSEVLNVTTFTQAMWQAYFGCQSQYVFHEVNGNTVTCTVPFVYEEMDPNEASDPVQFWYIDGVTFDFTMTNIEEPESNFGEIKIRPNPATGVSFVDIDVAGAKVDQVSIKIFTITGQQVFETEAGSLSTGHHSIPVDVSQLNSGIYFYTVIAKVEGVACNASGKLVVD